MNRREAAIFVKVAGAIGDDVSSEYYKDATSEMKKDCNEEGKRQAQDRVLLGSFA